MKNLLTGIRVDLCGHTGMTKLIDFFRLCQCAYKLLQNAWKGWKKLQHVCVCVSRHGLHDFSFTNLRILQKNKKLFPNTWITYKRLQPAHTCHDMDSVTYFVNQECCHVAAQKCLYLKIYKPNHVDKWNQYITKMCEVCCFSAQTSNCLYHVEECFKYTTDNTYSWSFIYMVA
jgi:hypothetical protein